MKTILLCALVLLSFNCYASVTRGSGNTYHVDRHGAPIETNNPKDKLSSKIKFMPESEAVQIQGFKTTSPLALF